MARVFVTGSADGLGRMAAELLVADGHEVVVHGRSEGRRQDALAAVPGAMAAVSGDLSSIAQTRGVAEQVNALGPFDAVVHNAGVGFREDLVRTEDGLAHVFAINVLAPYLLTALIARPQRLIYLSSSLHHRGDPALDDLQWERRRWDGTQAYADSKLFDAVLAFAVARRWPGVASNAVEPGWVATKMGGPGAPDDLEQGAVTQAWLAASDDGEALLSGRYLYHQAPRDSHPAASSAEVQDGLLAACAQLTGVTP